MSTFASTRPALQDHQKSLSGRLSSVLWQIRTTETQYHEFTFFERRNIHNQGAKTQFLLAGIFEHCPTKENFKKTYYGFLNGDAGGPGEFCPVIDIFQDVRTAQKLCKDWLKSPYDYTVAQITNQITKAEKVAENVQVLLAAMKRGGDQTPPLPAGTESFDEYCDRVKKHHAMVCGMSEGYDGRWAEVPSNDGELSTQQIINNWNGVCGLLMEKNMPLEKALGLVRAATREMEFEELAWVNQDRVWFEWDPKLAA